MKAFLGTMIISCAIAQVSAQNFLPEITPSFNNASTKMSCRVFSGSYTDATDFVEVLAVSTDSSVYDAVKDKYSPMKGNISDVYLFQDQTLGIKGDSTATVFLTFDKNSKDEVLGDGGGLVMFKMKRNKKTKAWEIKPDSNNAKTKKVYFRNVNLDAVGGSVYNKKITYVGIAGANGHRFLLTEDVSTINSNKDLIGFQDTSDYVYPAKFTQATKDRSVIPAGKSVKKYQSMGFPIEIEGKTGAVIGKLHRMGRGVTSVAKFASGFVYAIGGNPSVLLYYNPAENPNNSTELYSPRTGNNLFGDDGSTYVSYYKQNADGSGEFLPLNSTSKIDTIKSSDPNNDKGYDLKFNQIFDSLLVVKENALKAGATMFANIGDIAVTTDQQGYEVILISEKGIDNSGDLYIKNKYNGTLANHLIELDSTGKTALDGKFSDPYGRILSISSSEVSGILSVLTKGGQNTSGNSFFSNPDRIEVLTGTPGTIIVKENIPAITLGRNPNTVTGINQRVNEAFLFESGDPNGVLGVGYNDLGQYLATPVPASEYKLILSSLQGSQLSSGSGTQTSSSGNFTINSKTNYPNDGYLMVENGKLGTDASRVLIVRNLYPQNANCVGIITGFENFSNNSDENAKISYWPNPTHGVVKASRVGNYFLSNMNGTIVKSFKNTDVIDLNEFAKGLYVIKDEMGVSSKIVVY